MCCKETNTIKAKLFRLILGIALAMLIFGANSIDASAGEGHCRHASCGCASKGPSSCIGTTCWFHSMSDRCSGHSFTKSNKETTQTGSVSRTCTRDGKAYYSWVQYYRCTMSGCSRQHERGESGTYDVTTAYASGHNWSGWYDYGSNDYHKNTCQNSWHDTGVDGQKEYTESHSLTGHLQRNDWKWHRDCTTDHCYRRDCRWYWNYGTVRFYFENKTEDRGNYTNGNITSPGSYTEAGKTLVGWNKHTSEVKVYHVQQVPGAQLATWNWGAGSSKSVQEVVPGAQNSESASDRAGAVYEYNQVHVRYRCGFNSDGTGTGLIKDNFQDWVDYTQNLDSRKIDQFTRTGYDIITKGWFTTKTNENTYTHNVDKIGDAVCGDTAAYTFNTNYLASGWSASVATQYITDVIIYPHWRAHVLHVNYDTNGGVNSAGKSGIIETATMYYDDGKSDMSGAQKKYYMTNTIPTKAGYVFMGWGNKATWSQERYARQIANEATGIKVAYDNTQAKSGDNAYRTAQDWAAYCGKDLAAGDQTVTFYAQWERVITYKFYYYNDEANKAYYYEGGYQDCNTASVAFHNDDDEYLYMDIYMKRCCKAAFSVQKDADSGFFLCEKLSRPSHYRWTIF